MTHARQASPTVARVAIPQARALHTDPVGAPPPEVRVPALDAPRRTWLDPLVVGIVVLIVGVSILDGVPVGGYFDDGMYVVLAKALATGHGYHWLNLPGYPAATHFPPGYPFVLSLLWRVFPSFPGNVIVFKAANIVFLACSAAGVAIFARRRVGLPRWGAVAVALSASLGLPTLILGTQVMSEPFFLALLFPTLLFAERIADGDRRIGAIVALGVAVGLVTLVRTHGIAIAAGVGIVLLLRRRIRDAAIFSATVVAMVLPWQIWSRLNERSIPDALGGTYESYTTWLAHGFRDLGPSLIVHTVTGVAGEIGALFALLAAPSMPRDVKLAAIAVVVGLFLLGMRRLWATTQVTSIFVIVYLSIVLLWPFTPVRFIWGMWPLLFLLPVLGALEIARWRPRSLVPRAARLAAMACALLVAAGYGRYTRRAYAGHWWSSLARRNADAARPLVQWVRTHTPPDAVVASNYEPMVYLYGNRMAVPAARFTVRDYFRSPTAAESAEALRAILGLYHVDDVAVVSLDSVRVALQNMANEATPELVLVDQLPNGMIYSPAHR